MSTGPTLDKTTLLFQSVKIPPVLIPTIIEVIKKCEEDGSLIIRLYECHGAGIKVKVQLGFETADISLVDLMEDKTNQSSYDINTQTLTFKPFEIHTLKVSVKS